MWVSNKETMLAQSTVVVAPETLNWLGKTLELRNGESVILFKVVHPRARGQIVLLIRFASSGQTGLKRHHSYAEGIRSTGYVTP